MEPTIFSLLLIILVIAAEIAILYFTVKAAVKEGIKEAYANLNVYLRNLVTAAIREAGEEAEKEKAEREQS